MFRGLSECCDSAVCVCFEKGCFNANESAQKRAPISEHIAISIAQSYTTHSGSHFVIESEIKL